MLEGPWHNAYSPEEKGAFLHAVEERGRKRGNIGF